MFCVSCFDVGCSGRGSVLSLKLLCVPDRQHFVLWWVFLAHLMWAFALQYEHVKDIPHDVDEHFHEIGKD